MGFDGTSKSSRAHGQSIRYWEATSPYLDALKAKVIDAASKRAVDFLDPLNYPGPDVLVDAASFVDDEVSTQRKSGWLIAVFMSAVRIAVRCLVKPLQIQSGFVL